jgi:hypothetical protein
MTTGQVNTRIVYLYRDGSNYKRWGRVVFGGACDAAMRELLVAALDGGGLFIARQVGLPELFFEGSVYADDHCWHELAEVDATEDAVDDPRGRTIGEFVEEVVRAAVDGWRVFERV